MEPLSEVTNANGRDPLASASTWPITPPWVKSATRWPVWAAASRPTASRTRAVNSVAGSAPGMTSKVSSAHIRMAMGWCSDTILRNRPPSHSPRPTSRRPASTRGTRPSRAASGAAVSAVRRRVET